MTTAQILGYIFGPTGLVAGIIALAALIRHNRNPQAHAPKPPRH